MPLGAPVPAGRGSASRHALTKIDGCGRIADRSTVQALGWEPRQRGQLTLVAGVAVQATPDAAGPLAIVNGQGHLRLPVSVRRACGLEPGDQLLLVADRDRAMLVGYTMAALNAMIHAWQTHDEAGARA